MMEIIEMQYEVGDQVMIKGWPDGGIGRVHLDCWKGDSSVLVRFDYTDSALWAPVELLALITEDTNPGITNVQLNVAKIREDMDSALAALSRVTPVNSKDEMSFFEIRVILKEIRRQLPIKRKWGLHHDN